MSSEETPEKRKYAIKQWVLFAAGLIAMVSGIAMIVFFGGRKVFREYQKYKLMQENPVIEIAELGIKAPVLKGRTAPPSQGQPDTSPVQEPPVRAITALQPTAAPFIRSTSTN